MRRGSWRLIHSIVFMAVIAIFFLSYVRHVQHAHVPSQAAIQSSQQITQSSGITAPEFSNATCHMHGVLPDPTCTPGATNPDVTQANTSQTICTQGYTKTIRPSVTYTDHLKAQQMSEYGFTDSIRDHEEDHLIPLELGGAPSDPKNLWPEPQASPNAKDKVEDFLNLAVCDNRISLQDAQQRIATNWASAEQGL